MDGGAWWATVHRVTKSQTQLSDITLTSLVAQRVKRLPAMQETWVLIPESGRSPGEGNGNPLQ